VERITLLFDQEIRIGLDLSGYRLIPGYSSGHIGLPMEIYLHLYAVRNEDKTLIAGPDDLSRFVTRISSEDEAWRFLRLFTALSTHYLFQKRVYIIDLGVSLVSDQVVDSVVISPEVAERVGYKSPDMRRQDQEYIARRDLVCANPLNLSIPVSVLRRREALAEDGTYRFIEDQVIGEIERTEVPFPAYE